VGAGCGGCTWQHLAPDGQVAAKVAVVTEALARTGGLPDAVVTAGPGLPPWAFRTTLRLGVRGGRAGFRRHASHELVPVDHCLVAHPRLDDLLRAGRFPGATEVTARCSAATGARLVLVDPPSAVPDVPADVATHPDAHLVEEVAGVRFRISARSFFQTRPDGAAALVAAVGRSTEGAVAGGVLADLYAGVGLFGATVGAAASRVMAVEVAPSSVADARVNLPHAVVVARSVEEWRAEPADSVVADPPRAGLGREAARVVAATGAGRLGLVSCDPVSLARDAALLRAHGFRHVWSEVVDLFPHTPHVEVVTRFDR
jgi:23S rRNA (uracil1939-C5)-methyltransferase